MRTGGNHLDWKVIPLAPAGVEVFKSPELDKVFIGNPSIISLPGSRIVVSVDLKGPGVKGLRGIKGRSALSGHWFQGKLFISTDKGATWTCKNDFPFLQAQLFRVESTVYLLGLAGDFKIMRSFDGGETWSKAENLMQADGDYELIPSHVLYTKDHVYLAVLKRTANISKTNLPDSTWTPVILSARLGSDLMSRKAWSFSEPGKPLDEFLPPECLAYFGITGPAVTVSDPARQTGKTGRPRPAGRLEWDSPHVLEIRDPGHKWHDPAGRTLYLLSTARFQCGNVAALARLVTDETGRMTIERASTSGLTPSALVSLPGGNLKFDITYDDDTHLYWLVSNLVSGNMSRTDKASPSDNRLRLQLHFSKNLVDWCFAGCVDAGLSMKELRHFCSMAIHGSDLYVVSCSGQTRPGNGHYTDRITFHSIPSFRDLVY